MDEDKVLAALDALRGDVAARFEGVEARMAEGFAAADGKMTQLRTVLMGKFEEMQNELAAIRDDLTVSANAAMRAVKRTDGDRDDMRDLNQLVNSMLVSLQRLRTDVDELKGRR